VRSRVRPLRVVEGEVTELEREALRKHEAYMSQPVCVLFPKPKGFSRVISCKGCGKEFTWKPSCGKIRLYCSSNCRTANGSSKPRWKP
jgi:hypothetical protein